jgi:hypothetical protein
MKRPPDMEKIHRYIKHTVLGSHQGWFGYLELVVGLGGVGGLTPVTLKENRVTRCQTEPLSSHALEKHGDGFLVSIKRR